jgi:hypothetical protein
MARPLRIEYAGAIYHVTSRGDRQETIFDDDQDCTGFLNERVTLSHGFDGSAMPILDGHHYHAETREFLSFRDLADLYHVFAIAKTW